MPLLKLVDQPEGKSSGERSVTLRHAVNSDSGFIGRLSREVFDVYGPYGDILTRWFNKGKGVSTLIACHDKIQIGFAMLSWPSDLYNLEDVSELLGLAVDPEIQGQGVGELLLCAMDKVSESLSVRWIFLHTAVENIPAQNLYKKNGYRPVEFKRSFYPEGQDALVMYKSVKRIHKITDENLFK